MKYKQITDYIKGQLTKDVIKPGGRLPSIREIAETFYCSKSTVVRAYDELEKEHFIYSVPNSGYFLVENNYGSGSSGRKDIIDFVSGAPDLDVLPYKEFKHCIDQSIEIYKESLFSYTETEGLKPLIKEVTKQLQDHQVFAPEGSVFITTGSQQALDILCRMPFPNGKDNIALEQPAYYCMVNSIELSGVRAIGVKREMDGLNMDDLERVFKNGNVKFFYTVPRFSNPLGLSFTNAEKKHIADLAEKYDVYIIEDDFMGDMDTDSKADPIYAFDRSSRVIYIKTYSKILMPGLRISAAVIPKLLVNTFREYKRCADLSTPVLSQGALEVYLKSGMFKAHSKKVRDIYSKRLGCLREILQRYNSSNIRYNVPVGGFFAGIEILNGNRAKDIIESPELSNIMISPIEINYIKNFMNDRMMRLSIARVNEEKIQKSVPLILDAIGRSKIDSYKVFEI